MAHPRIFALFFGLLYFCTNLEIYPSILLNREADDTYDERTRMAVLYFFRKRLEYLQWTLLGNKEVPKVKVHVPAGLPEDNRQKFTSLYRIWLVIFKILCWRSVVEKENTKNYDYIQEFKNKLISVGLKPNPGTEETYAADVAYLMINLSQYSKMNFAAINWKNETQVMRELSDVEGEQQKIARAVYRLKLIGNDIWYD